MTTAREIMTKGSDFISSDSTAAEAAKKMVQGDVGAVPICDGGKLKGVVTDRDIAVKVVAQGRDPAKCTVGELMQGEVVTIGADDPVEEAIRTMKHHKVRRLPVIDGTELVGMVSQGDLAKHVSDDKVGDLVEAISAAP